MEKIKYLLPACCLAAIYACSGKQQATVQEAPAAPERTFRMVEIPAMISDPEQRIDYLTVHYWDRFDFADTAYIDLPDVTEQAFSNYVAFAVRAHPEQASASIKGMLKKAEADSAMYAYFTGLCEKYLYDPNAPTRNEELYIFVLESILASPTVDDVRKIRPAHLLELALKNRVGTKATDFTYTLSGGRTGKMYQLKADYLLLFFYNPDCTACRELTGQLSQSLLIRKMQQEGRLKTLAVYPDEDLQLWKDHLDHFPGEWIVSYDAAATLNSDEVYDLKAIPCLYLLDKDKKVILKDTYFDQLMDYLSLINR